MEMGDHRVRATRSRAAVHPGVTGLTGFELFILALVAAMAADVGLFGWLLVHEFAR